MPRAFLALLLLSCGLPAASSGDFSGTGEVLLGAGGGGGGNPSPLAFYDGGTGGLPCDVATFVSEKCLMCHGAPLAGNATFPLLTRADFLQPSALDPSKSLYQQARIRIHNPFNPMPPVGYHAPTVTDVLAFDSWEMAGAPAGTCDAAHRPMQPTTCPSGQFWNGGNTGNASMNPGLACRACHLGQNFQGQNPTGASEPQRAFFFMGTAFAGPHAKNLCVAAPPAGAKVEIYGKNGTLALTLPVTNTSGNFYSTGTSTSVALPYTARVVANGKTVKMLTPQTSGDCNGCHTEQGEQGAPGRIYWPM